MFAKFRAEIGQSEASDWIAMLIKHTRDENPVKTPILLGPNRLDGNRRKNE
jgi:hypothetical protein